MTMYAGETIRIRNASTFQDRALTPDDMDTVTVTIYDSAATPNVLVDGADMSWDDGTQNDAGDTYFYYDWDTTDLDAGSYLARVYEEGPGTRKSWEYIKVRLTKDKI